MSLRKQTAATLGMAALLVLGSLSGCKSTTSNNVEMKLNVAGADVAVDSATTNSPTAGNFYTNGFPNDLRLNADGSIN